MPDSPAALHEHECLRIVNTVMPSEKWTFEGPEGTQTFTIPLSPLHINTADSMSIAIKKGIGIGIQPVASAVEGLMAGTLVQVLPQYRLEELNLYAIYPSRKFVDAKIKTWVEFLKQSIPQMLTSNDAMVSAKN
jgi:DNA-binding transcriptional LysR family regulator